MGLPFPSSVWASPSHLPPVGEGFPCGRTAPEGGWLSDVRPCRPKVIIQMKGQLLRLVFYVNRKTHCPQRGRTSPLNLSLSKLPWQYRKWGRAMNEQQKDD